MSLIPPNYSSGTSRKMTPESWGTLHSNFWGRNWKLAQDRLHSFQGGNLHVPNIHAVKSMAPSHCKLRWQTLILQKEKSGSPDVIARLSYIHKFPSPIMCHQGWFLWSLISHNNIYHWLNWNQWSTFHVNRTESSPLIHES